MIVRLEFPKGHYQDEECPAADLDSARLFAMEQHPEIELWEWHGSIAWVNGAEQAEWANADIRRLTGAHQKPVARKTTTHSRNN